MSSLKRSSLTGGKGKPLLSPPLDLKEVRRPINFSSPLQGFEEGATSRSVKMEPLVREERGKARLTGRQAPLDFNKLQDAALIDLNL